MYVEINISCKKHECIYATKSFKTSKNATNEWHVKETPFVINVIYTDGMEIYLVSRV